MWIRQTSKGKDAERESATKPGLKPDYASSKSRLVTGWELVCFGREQNTTKSAQARQPQRERNTFRQEKAELWMWSPSHSTAAAKLVFWGTGEHSCETQRCWQPSGTLQWAPSPALLCLLTQPLPSERPWGCGTGCDPQGIAQREGPGGVRSADEDGSDPEFISTRTPKCFFPTGDAAMPGWQYTWCKGTHLHRNYKWNEPAPLWIQWRQTQCSFPRNKWSPWAKPLALATRGISPAALYHYPSTTKNFWLLAAKTLPWAPRNFWSSCHVPKCSLLGFACIVYAHDYRNRAGTQQGSSSHLPGPWLSQGGLQKHRTDFIPSPNNLL